MWNPDTELQEHAEGYAAAHGGRHPYTDAWPWAEAIVGWYRTRPRRLTSRREVVLDEDAWALVVAGVAEALRLRMRCSELGDIRVDLLTTEFGLWARYGVDVPAPGEPGWPAPSGPYADRWDALADALTENGERARATTRAVTAVLGELEFLARSRDHLPRHASTELTGRRLAERGYDEVTLAEVCGVLGAGPIPVRDPAHYAGAGLDLVAAAG
ncbi:hypothetical protein ABZW10_36390 [Kitasatospora sp. NPDC004723]|uniref:hypothetical protein n=1 Tax=Kitasatospora sp. NPDC004723 TaxID=3154288 RepID=UPI0033B15CD2